MSITWSFYPPWDIFNIFGKEEFCLIIYRKTYCDQAPVQGCCLRQCFGSPLSSLNRKLGARATFFSSPLGFKFPEKCLFASFSQQKLFAYSRWTRFMFSFQKCKMSREFCHSFSGSRHRGAIPIRITNFRQPLATSYQLGSSLAVVQ